MNDDDYGTGYAAAAARRTRSKRMFCGRRPGN